MTTFMNENVEKMNVKEAVLIISSVGLCIGWMGLGVGGTGFIA